MTERPNPLPRLYRWRTNVVQTPLFGIVTALCGSLALLFSLFDKTGNLQHRVARIWARASIWISGSKLTVIGAENLRKCKTAVYTSNHTSYMDTPVIFASLPFQFRILARKDLWSIPFIGWYLNRSGQLPIDTVNPRSTLSSLSGAAKVVGAGTSLFVFPEGRRTPDGNLRPFLSGAAFLAIRAQVPIVPMALSGVYELLPIHTHHFYPGKITLTVGEPIETVGMTVRQAEELTGRLRAAIEALRRGENRSAVEAEIATVHADI